jgi:3-deoxy-D-manno-octulosonic-acid transferase
VSVGEVQVALKILTKVREQQPTLPLVLSTTTATGFQLAKRDVPANTEVIYSPVDFGSVVKRFLDTLRPSKIVLVEAEVWPNLLAEARKREIPVVLANARLSPRSARRYKRFRWLIEPIFSQLHSIYVQFPEDVEHWKSFGIAATRIHLLGSVKYDDRPASPKRVAEFRSLLESVWGPELPPTVLLASSFPGEELALLQAFQHAQVHAKLLLVPRHVERTADLIEELAKAGFAAVRRSQLPLPAPSSCQAVIVDTTGELRDWQYLPQAVVIGKSFLHKGGQNPVEAITAGTPVITGPHMDNFGSLMRQLLAVQGLQQVHTLTAAAGAVSDILKTSASAQASIAKARQALATHQGAAERTATALAS